MAQVFLLNVNPVIIWSTCWLSNPFMARIIHGLVYADIRPNIHFWNWEERSPASCVRAGVVCFLRCLHLYYIVQYSTHIRVQTEYFFFIFFILYNIWCQTAVLVFLNKYGSFYSLAFLLPMNIYITSTCVCVLGVGGCMYYATIVVPYTHTPTHPRHCWATSKARYGGKMKECHLSRVVIMMPHIVIQYHIPIAVHPLFYTFAYI